MLFLFASSCVFADSSQFVYGQSGIYFTGSSSDPATVYQDAIGGNLDVGIELCDIGQRYVGGFYAANVSGTFLSSLVTYSTSSLALAFTDVINGSCAYTTPGFLTISASNLVTPDPEVFKAAFPARLWTGYDVVANPGPLTTFVFGGDGSLLLGNYSMDRNFSQANREITIATPNITFETTSGTFVKDASDTDFGITSDRQMVVAICDDDGGETCSDGQLLTSASFPIDLDSGLGAGQVNDQQTHTKYVVINGIGTPMCIGANLQVSIDLLDPSPVYFSQDLSVDITLSNPLDSPFELYGGQVDVTTDFSYNIVVMNVSNNANVIYDSDGTITATIASDDSTTANILVPMNALSGDYVVQLTVDSNSDIAECDETDNVANATVTLRPVTTPIVVIDNETTGNFSFPHSPYVVTTHFRNSDNQTLRNATIQLVEQNGLNLNSGTQLYNHTFNSSGGTQATGLVSRSITEYVTDYYGNKTYTYIPLYNSLYNPEYSYLDLDSYVGSYAIYLTGTESDGDSLYFIVNGSVTTQYALNLTNTTTNNSIELKTLENTQTISQSFDFLYRAFNNFITTLIGGPS